MIKDYPKVSIIFPNLNGDKKNLETLLASIDNSSYPKDKLEIIMVDNGSDPKSVDFLKEFIVQSSSFRFVENKKNLGFGPAVNIGAKHSIGDFLFVTNNDCILDKNTLEILVKYLVNNPEVGVTGPKTYKKDGKNLYHPAPRYNFYLGLFHDSRKPNKIQNSDWIPGSGLLASRDLWNKLDGFDENMFFTYEDLDLCLRAKKLGFKVVYNPEAVMTHNHGSTINRPEFSYFRFYHGYKGKIRTILKHGNPLQAVTSLFLQFLIFAPFRYLVLSEKSLVPLFRALRWNLKNLPK